MLASSSIVVGIMDDDVLIAVLVSLSVVVVIKVLDVQVVSGTKVGTKVVDL